MDKHKRISSLEVVFEKSNFMHLTGCGVHSNSSASDFYNKCISHKLRVDDFELSSDNTARLKLEVLPALTSPNLNANAIGNYNSLNPRLITDRLVGHVKGCMGFDGTLIMHYIEIYRLWRDRVADAEMTAELEAMAGDEALIEDAFYRELEFGTAGLRGVIGAGTNRMNVYTVAKATQGLVFKDC